MTRPGIKPVLVNLYEKVTDRLLTEQAAASGDRLLAKVRLADVIEADALTGRAKDYALRAHLDFVMVNADTLEPRFAVELDGAQHRTDPTVRERDQLKDQLCDTAGLPLLRITADLTRKHGRWVVLSYLVDAFYLAEAFYEAQETGAIPWDEPFDAGSFITSGPDGQTFNSLDASVRGRLWSQYKAGQLLTPVPDTFLTAMPDGPSVVAHSFLAVAPHRYLISRVEVRSFSFPGVGASELASELSVVEIGDLADEWLAGGAVARSASDLLRQAAEVQRHIDAGGFLGSSTGGGIDAGGPVDMGLVVRLRAPSRSTPAKAASLRPTLPSN